MTGLGFTATSAWLFSNHVTVGKFLSLGLYFSIHKGAVITVPVSRWCWEG